MLIGAATQNLSGSDWPTNLGPLTCRRSFNGSTDFAATYGVPTSFSASNAGIDASKGLVSIYSFKPDISLMAGASLDDAVNAFLDSIPAGQKMILTVWHEPGSKVRQGVFTVTQWQAAFTHFCNLVHAKANPNLATAYIDSAYQPTTAGSLYGDIWPGPGYADYFLTDGYTDLGSGDSVWKKGADAAKGWGIPWGIGEIGVRSGTISNTWMATQTRWAMDNNAVCLCWFDSNSGGVVPTPGTDANAVATAMTVSTLLQVDPATVPI
jgi:hypothetical protein